MKLAKIVVYLFFIILLLILSKSNILGQSNNESRVETEVLRSNFQNRLNHNNEIYLEQIGNSHSAGIIQSSPGQSGNSAAIYQSGRSEEIILEQIGDKNTLSIHQIGQDNYARIQKNGNDISSEIFQVGSGNEIQLKLNGSDKHYEIIQRGSDHQLINRNSGNSGPGFKVKQSGISGMKVTVEQR